MTARAIIMASALSAAASVAHAQGEVTLRGERKPLQSSTLTVSSHGVTLESEPGSVITWDRIKYLDHNDWPAYTSIAQDAWRARARFDRGEIVLAAPLFEALFDTYRNDPGPMQAFAARGHRACLVALGMHDDAIEPMLLAHAADPSERFVSDASMPQPIWLTGNAPDLSASLDSESELARLFAVAARFEREGTAHTPEQTDDRSIGPLRDVVAARTSDDPSVRSNARERLVLDADRHAGTWREARARLAIARSLLREPGRDQRHLATIELAHVSARFRSAAPRLASIAFAELIRLTERETSTPGSTQTLRASLSRVPGSAFAQRWIDEHPQPNEPES
ncbi:MAG: hypothetical protein AAGD00_06695 [Planctomycetota bacterium]